MTSLGWRRALSLALLFIGAGCSAGDSGRLLIGLEMSALSGPMADPGTPVMDDDGFAHLDRFPLFLNISINAEDMEAPVVARWPEEVPDSTPEVIELELEVEAGQARQVDVELLYVIDEVPRTAVSPLPGDLATTVDIEAGQLTEADIAVTPLELALVTAQWSSSVSVTQIEWIDVDAQVVHPPLEPEGGSSEISSELAVGRTYIPRITLDSGEVTDLTSAATVVISGDQTVDLDI